MSAPGNGLDARYEQLRHAALHARAEAFGLGFAVLTRHGVTAWRHTLTVVAGDDVGHRRTVSTQTSPCVPVPVAAELVNALTTLVLAGS